MVFLGQCSHEGCGVKLNMICSKYQIINYNDQPFFQEIILRYCDKHKDSIVADYYNRIRPQEEEYGCFTNLEWINKKYLFNKFKIYEDNEQKTYNDGVIDQRFILYNKNNNMINFNIMFNKFTYIRWVSYEELASLNDESIIPTAYSILHEHLKDGMLSAQNYSLLTRESSE